MNFSTNSLYIVSTPIGNLDDITLRAIDVLKNSDFILCEDTRHSLKLLNHLKIKKKLISYHKFNEKKNISSVLSHINRGKILSLISDAGTPLLSDPGKVLLNACVENKIKIIPIPGVSSVTSALSASGFDDKFIFYGFLPKTINELDKVFSALSKQTYTQIFFIPAIKINFYLKKIKDYYAGRKLLIAKEMTKIHEAFFREDIDKLNVLNYKLKGELTLVISESSIKKININEKNVIFLAKKYLKKYSLKDTVDLIFAKEKLNKKAIYKLCLSLKNEKIF